MKPALNDEEVIRQYRNTNPNECFELLYNRYVRKVYNRCYSMTKNSEQAQDYTHDIFLRMFAHLDRFQERSSFSTWLYSISYNYCIDQIKRSNRLATTDLDQETEYAVAQSADSESAENNLQQLAKAMESIAPQEALILRMKYQEGLDVLQIAKKLNLKESAVKMRLKRSRDKVRTLCEASLWAS